MLPATWAPEAFDNPLPKGAGGGGGACGKLLDLESFGIKPGGGGDGGAIDVMLGLEADPEHEGGGGGGGGPTGTTEFILCNDEESKQLTDGVTPQGGGGGGGAGVENELLTVVDVEVPEKQER